MPSAVQHRIDPWQEHLDFLLPRREMLRPDDVARALGVDQKTVTRTFEAEKPELLGVEINGGGKERMHRRILRDSVILYYAQHANYTPEEFLARLTEVLGHRTLRELVILQQQLAALIARKQS